MEITHLQNYEIPGILLKSNFLTLHTWRVNQWEFTWRSRLSSYFI